MRCQKMWLCKRSLASRIRQYHERIVLSRGITCEDASSGLGYPRVSDFGEIRGCGPCVCSPGLRKKEGKQGGNSGNDRGGKGRGRSQHQNCATGELEGVLSALAVPTAPWTRPRCQGMLPCPEAR